MLRAALGTAFLSTVTNLIEFAPIKLSITADWNIPHVCALNGKYTQNLLTRNVCLIESPEGRFKSLMHGFVSEALACGKVVWGDPCTEVSQTAKV